MDQCNFVFDYRIDVIEEDALNRKYCIEVLKRLTSKADTDIEKLEGELLVYESQSEWAKDGNNADFLDTCSKALKKEIELIRLSMCSLKNKYELNEENYSAFQSEMRLDSLKKIHEFTMDLLNKRFHDKDEQDGQQAEVTLMEDDISDAPIHLVIQGNDNPSLHIVSSSDKTDEDEVIEPVLTPKDIGYKSVFSSEPEKISNETEKVKFQEAGVARTTSTENQNLKSYLMLQEQEHINMTVLKEVKLEPPGSPINDMVFDITSSLKMQKKKGGNKIRQDKSRIHKAGVSKTTKSDSRKPSSGLQDQSSQQIDVQQQRSSASTKHVLIESSLESQKKRKKVLPLSEKIKVKESAQAAIPVDDSVKSKSITEGNNGTQSVEVVLLESRSAAEVHNPKVSLLLPKKKQKDSTQSKSRSGRKSPNSNNGASITLFSDMDLKQKVAGIATHTLAVLPAAEGGKKPSKEKRKHPTQVDAPKESGPSSKRQAKCVVSSSQEVKKPSKARAYHFTVEDYFKSWDSNLNGSSLDELQKPLSSGSEPGKLSKIGDSQTTLQNELQKSPCPGSELSKVSKNGNSHILHHNEPKISLCSGSEPSFSQALIGQNDLHQLTLVDLKSLAKQRGLRGYSKFTKEKLFQLLTEVRGD